MVVSAHKESSRIGVLILKNGGNAIDAAVATEFALAVCYPSAGNIGGGGFMLVRMADGKTDLIDYRAVFRDPLTIQYRGFRVISAPPPSAGGVILLQLLAMIEPYSLLQSGFHSPQTIHLMVEAEKRAFADRAQHLGDPDFMKISVNELFTKDYVSERMKNFNPEAASPSSDIKPGIPAGFESEETTHYSVVDLYGNAVSSTTTLNNSFGSSIVVDGAGFILNNQMDDFSVKPGIPNIYGLTGGEVNSIYPGKRMLSSMTPMIIERNGKVIMVAGSSGGSTIPTTVFQVAVNVLDFGMNIQEAVEAGRFHHQWLPDYIRIEKNSIDSITLEKLTKMGHELKIWPAIGRVNAIQILPDGSKMGGADNRGNNSASGY